MKVRARLELDFADEGEARRMMAALGADDDGYVRQRVEGKTLVAEAEAEGAGALRETLEDYMACLSAAALASAKKGK